MQNANQLIGGWKGKYPIRLVQILNAITVGSGVAEFTYRGGMSGGVFSSLVGIS